jgi:hypothetical protein
MKLQWLEPTLANGRAHLCAVDEAGNVQPLCEHIFLTAAAEAQAETAKCPDCEKIEKNGKEISVTTGVNEKVVLRPEMPAAYRGSLDPFEDAVQMLKHIGVMYVLLVGIKGQRGLRFWTNASQFGRPGLDELKRQTEKLIKLVENRVIESEQQKG